MEKLKNSFNSFKGLEQKLKQFILIICAIINLLLRTILLWEMILIFFQNVFNHVKFLFCFNQLLRSINLINVLNLSLRLLQEFLNRTIVLNFQNLNLLVHVTQMLLVYFLIARINFKNIYFNDILTQMDLKIQNFFVGFIKFINSFLTFSYQSSNLKFKLINVFLINKLFFLNGINILVAALNFS